MNNMQYENNMLRNHVQEVEGICLSQKREIKRLKRWIRNKYQLKQSVKQLKMVAKLSDLFTCDEIDCLESMVLNLGDVIRVLHKYRKII